MDLSLHSSSDRDFFRFTTPQAGFVVLKMEADLEQGDVRGKVLDAEDNVVFEKTSAMNDWEVLFPVEEGEEYVLEFFPMTEEVHPSYSFSVINQLLPDGNEPDSFSDPTSLGSLSLGQSMVVSDQNRDDPLDIDYFEFTTESEGSLLIRLNLLFPHPDNPDESHILTFQLTNIDTSFSFAPANSIPGESHLEWSSTNMPAGFYRIEVQAYGSAMTPGYELVINSGVPKDFSEYAAAAGQAGAGFEGELALMYAFGVPASSVGVTQAPDIEVDVVSPGLEPRMMVTPALSDTRLPIRVEMSTDGVTWDLVPASSFTNPAIGNPIPIGSSGPGPVFDRSNLPGDPKKAFFRLAVENAE